MPALFETFSQIQEAMKVMKQIEKIASSAEATGNPQEVMNKAMKEGGFEKKLGDLKGKLDESSKSESNESNPFVNCAKKVSEVIGDIFSGKFFGFGGGKLFDAEKNLKEEEKQCEGTVNYVEKSLHEGNLELMGRLNALQDDVGKLPTPSPDPASPSSSTSPSPESKGSSWGDAFQGAADAVGTAAMVLGGL